MGFIMGTHLNFFIVLLFLFLGCKVNAQKSDAENYEVYANQVVSSFASEMEKEFGLICIGEGGGMPRDVEKMSVEFISYQRATIELARELEVKVTERFIEAINAHRKLRPFLREYPVQPFRAEVAISFNKKDNRSYTDGSVSRVFQVRHIIFYKKEDSSSPTGFVKLLEEPYDDALRIVQSE